MVFSDNSCFQKYRFLSPLILFFMLSNISVFAQGISVSGKVTDKTSQDEMIGANVLLLRLPDSSQVNGTVVDIDGTYRLMNVRRGRYVIKVSYLGYHTVSRVVMVEQNDLKDINFELTEDAKVLQETQVEAIMPRMVVKGDTVQMNADAFKVNPDADASDLVTKMPGVMIQDGKVQAQGEEVKRVLVDGKEFFGDDAMMVLKNLPAEIVDKVQIFDRLSDQAQFTGFNDGNTEKTMNIVTRGQIKDGVFGRAYVGYGTDNRYTAGGNLNYFKGTRRISLVGLSNNINIQNFGSEDLIGVASSSSSNNRPSGGMGPRQGAGGAQGGPPGGFGENSVSNFLVAGQGGVSLTNGIGLNYVEDWKKVKLSANYFYNRTKNENNSLLDRQYLTEDFEQIYHQDGKSLTYNNNHRINAKIDYDIDDKKSFTFRPRFSFQNNDAGTIVNAITTLLSGETLSKSENDNSSLNNAYNLSNSILYKHKLGKQGRTYSIRLETRLNNRMIDNYLTANNYYSENIDSLIAQNQWTDGLSKTLSLGGEVNYTEPLGKKSQIQVNYVPSYTKSTSDRFTYQYNEATNDYTISDLSLSNVFENINWAHKTGTSYRYKAEKFDFNVGMNYQFTSLLSDRTFPTDIDVEKHYHNVLPSAQLGYKFTKTSSINLFYRTSVRTPTVSQLQDVVDNTNPLILSSGNKDLDQQYSHFVGMRWRFAQPAKGRSAFVFVGGGVNNNYITNSTILTVRDTMITSDIMLPAGGQLTKPVNLDGNWNVRSFFNYGTPLLFMKSNLNVNAGFSYNRIPNLVNELLQYNNTYNFNSGLMIGSNISEKVDFRLGYTANYNIVHYSQNTAADNNYYTGVANAAVNVLPWKGIVISSDVVYNHYIGLGDNYNTNFALWNAAVGYKFLKNRAAELRLQVFDILGVNNSISRTVTETYVQDSRVDVLDRYFMLHFTYKFNKFNTAATKENRQTLDRL